MRSKVEERRAGHVLRGPEQDGAHEALGRAPKATLQSY